MLLFTNKPRERFFKYPNVETFILMGAYLLLGYVIDPQDICMLEYKLSFLTILLAIITLFHGIESGILGIVIVGIAMKFGYAEFQYAYFLKEFVLVLIFGEFHYYWTRTIKHHDAESNFTKEKLLELGKAFYMLKISHDQIEKSYIIKPMSLRNSIGTIKEDFYKEDANQFYRKFLLLLQKTLNIETSFLLSVQDNENMTILAQTEEGNSFDIDDLMIQHAYEKQMPIYVSSDAQYDHSKYIAVIPSLSHNEVTGLLAIEKMPFMSFNKDTLISTSILVGYMFDEVNKVKLLKSINNFLPDFQENFRFETYRLSMLNKKFNADSTILVYKSYNNLTTHLLIEAINKNMRTLEIMSSAKKESLDVVIILFPFSDATSVNGFAQRIDSIMNTEKGSDILKFSTFSIAKVDLIESYVNTP